MRAPVRTLIPYSSTLFRFFNRRISTKTSQQNKWISNSPNKTITGIAIGSFFVGGLYSIYVFKSSRINEFTVGSENINNNRLSQRPPLVEASRKVRYPEDQSGLKITLYQYQTCPFCCKARSVLDYHGLSYDVVEVNSITRAQTKWTSYKKVPIVVIETPNGEVFQLNDSSLIISVIRSYYKNEFKGLATVLSAYPTVNYTDENNKVQTEIINKYNLVHEGVDTGARSNEDVIDERKWRIWVDNVFVHVISPNLYRTPTESLDTFKIFDRVGNWESIFSTWERYTIIYLGSLVMWIIGKRLKAKHHLNKDVRVSLYEEIDCWSREIKKRGTPFLGGQFLNMADISFYGALNAMEGTQAFHDLYKHTSIKTWYCNARDAIGNRQGRKHCSKY